MIDIFYLATAGGTLAMSLGAAALVRSRVAQAKLVPASSGLTGAEAAALLLTCASKNTRDFASP